MGGGGEADACRIEYDVMTATCDQELLVLQRNVTVYFELSQLTIKCKEKVSEPPALPHHRSRVGERDRETKK